MTDAAGAAGAAAAAGAATAKGGRKSNLATRDLLKVIHGPALDDNGEYRHRYGNIVRDIICLSRSVSSGARGSLAIVPSDFDPTIVNSHICAWCERLFLRDQCFVCSACRCEYYCSKRCQKLDWSRGGHERLCKRVPEFVSGLGFAESSYRRSVRAIDAAERIAIDLMSTQWVNPKTDALYLQPRSLNSVLADFMHKFDLNGRVIYFTAEEDLGDTDRTIIAARVLEAAVLQSYVQQLFAANMQLLTELASSRIDDTEARTKKYKCECRVYAAMLNVMSRVDPDEFIVALTSDVFPICVKKMHRHFQRPGQVHIGQRPEDTERHRLDTSNTFYTSETSDLP